MFNQQVIVIKPQDRTLDCCWKLSPNKTSMGPKDFKISRFKHYLFWNTRLGYNNSKSIHNMQLYNIKMKCVHFQLDQNKTLAWGGILIFEYIADYPTIDCFLMYIRLIALWFVIDGWLIEMNTYIPPNIRLINPISKRFTNNWRYISNELPSWVEPSQDLMLRSTVSFLIVTYSDTFLSFNHLSNCFFPCPLLFLAIYALHAGYLFVTDTNYYGTTFGGVPGSFNSDQIECMCSQNRPRFKVPSERLNNEVQVPCLRGLRTDQQKSGFLLSTTVPPQ